MKKETERYIREAREHKTQIADVLTRTGSLTVGQVESLFRQVYEYSFKAPVVEKSTGLGAKYKSHSLTKLCISYGLWPELPHNLQVAITEMDGYYPAYPGSVRYAAHVSSSSPAQWQHRVEMGRDLIELVERAIEDPARFSKFKF